jgi:hypothetical protein
VLALEKLKSEKVEFAIQVNESDLGIKKIEERDDSNAEWLKGEDGLPDDSKDDHKNDSENPLAQDKTPSIRDGEDFEEDSRDSIQMGNQEEEESN